MVQTTAILPPAPRVLQFCYWRKQTHTSGQRGEGLLTLGLGIVWILAIQILLIDCF